ncbi:phosphoenolpyruvate--protein phosphotransferase [Azospirillum sp. RWY-5-1]|uniref:phosphoenolpyruvate--protein phosphotransferase n=1 Tax=Azospirillum oleiclasticum TaxID=2735135 RepID=A0ABX2T6M7_9PROT|nr:phosphoenolpyruvate--protein phosphotransferase [Azospirillum oleiclasticum]NYZ12822.1 phosphoenolpyruvate--protein phosphotransferase [Azospirillum oleiclasticum]NYZ19982.1 phosphoenolpyruvate--protein phosphotransferase [Azospirillum oleiclasticum]
MLALSETQVRLGLTASDKTDAIRTAGRVMVECGLIEPGYIDSMLGRERVAATYLGSGIAIPHGLPQARDLVRRTGIVVVQFPGGVDWGSGEPARLVVGIAAKSDEHIAVLQRLTGVLGDPAEAERLGRTGDAGAIVAVLNGEAAPAPAASAASSAGGPSITVTAPVPHGLHARPATALVEVAKRFRAEIAVSAGVGVGNGKSLVSLLRLGVSGGQPLTVTASGDDADAALAAIRAAFEAGLDEPAADGAPSHPPAPVAVPPPADLDYDGTVIAGISASPGVSTGPAWTFQREELVVAETAPDAAAEHRRLDQALAGAGADLRNLHEEFWKKAGAAKAAIFKAHLELLDDPEMVADTHAGIDRGHSAGWAWRAVYEERAGTLAQLADPLLAGRAADLRDVGRRVLRLLADAPGTMGGSVAALPDHPVILLAEDLEPSDTAKLDPAKVLGLCTAGGGATSHTAIIARSLDIPAVVAAGPAALDVGNGREVILNGDDGVLVVGPSDRDRARATAARVTVGERREAERLDRYKPAITTDGKRVEIAANISDPKEAATAIEAGAEGVGLMRTEFLFLQREFPPDEEEQFEAYRTMVRAMNGLPIILRTLDIGGDKNVPYLRMPAEGNPFLGVRGIRLCFEREDLFRTQLRAMLRASKEGPVRIMYPMIATPAELAKAKAITEQVRREVGAGPVEIGIMIEVPSAVVMADRLAREVSFFSIGTNDLTQYVLAMDRLHPVLAPQADGLHPAVLRMVERTVAGARAAGIWVGACGGIAGDPAGAVLLAGLGLAELSVAIPAVASVKARLRGISMADAEAAARAALDCADAAEVRALVRDRFPGGAA